MVQKHFGGGLDYVKENDLYEAYGNAVQKVSLWFGLGVTAERLHTLVAGMGLLKLTAEEVDDAANKLMRSTSALDELRFRKLTPQHFRNAVRNVDAAEKARKGELGDGSASAGAFVPGEDGEAPYYKRRREAKERWQEKHGK